MKGDERDRFRIEDCGYGLDALRKAPNQPTPVTVAEDPVREAAKKLVAGWWNYEIKTYTAEGQRLINALREALTQPVPPSLTEDERLLILRHLPRMHAHHARLDADLKALREKLS